MGVYDGAKVCELLRLLSLNSSANKFDENDIGLYRDKCLPYSRMLTVIMPVVIRKEFHQLFN